MTTKDVIIQQLNDKLQAALTQAKVEVAQTMFVQPVQEPEAKEESTENDPAE